MKLLLDANLSRRLVPLLQDIFPDIAHVSRLGDATPDPVIWRYARENGYFIVTRDRDFYQMGTVLGAPPKIVWLRVGNTNTRNVERLLRAAAARIDTFAMDPKGQILILRR